MRARGVAFAAESIASLDIDEELAEKTFTKLERVVLSKFDDLIIHYLVKILVAFSKAGQGSGELYSQIIDKTLANLQAMKYSEMIRFFEVYTEVSYIYDNTMNEEYANAFSNKLKQVINEKKFPMEDLCKVFNILVKIAPYSNL